MANRNAARADLLVETIEADRYPFSPRLRRSAEMFILARPEQGDAA